MTREWHVSATRGLAVAKSVVTLSPWLLTILIVGPSIFPTAFRAALGATQSVQEVMWLGWLSVSLSIGWLWSIYRVSTAAANEPVRPPWIEWMFAAPPLLSALNAFSAYSSGGTTTLSLLLLGTLVFCLGQTAGALEAADPGKKPASWGRVLGAALLCFCLPVGVWVLRERLLRVASRTA
jgi:hypothetical protein